MSLGGLRKVAQQVGGGLSAGQCPSVAPGEGVGLWSHPFLA